MNHRDPLAQTDAADCSFSSSHMFSIFGCKKLYVICYVDVGLWSRFM